MKSETSTAWIRAWDVGHSSRSLDTFLKKLEQHGIEAVIDVRTYPTSRFAHFNREKLKGALEAIGLIYLDFGDSLGGRSGNIPQERFERSLKNIVQMARMMNVCLMCSEGNPDDCHRSSILQPALSKYEVCIEHILYTKEER